jgi:UDP-2,4-diacetamido-2,4,6-trideoxy-beta-L-altropyranose hydrolase
MRCLTLAAALREQGAACRFVCRTHPGNLLEEIGQRGFEVHALLPTALGPTDDDPQGEALLPHAAWLGTNWAADAQQTLTALGETPVDWLIVDHYALDARWERVLRAACRRLMVIDDLADRSHDCDLLLDQNLGRSATDYPGLVPRKCLVLAGPQYALLRPEFSVQRPYSLAHRKHPALGHLLITMGGVDKDNITSQILDALPGCSLPEDCRITVVMGPRAPWIAQVRTKAAGMPWPTKVLVNVRDMAKLMSTSDLAIGAAGTTAWERCCLGLPTLIVILADNQKKGALALQRVGAALLISNEIDLASDLNEKISMLMQPGGLDQVINASCVVTDGSGVFHLVNALTNGQH